ncbi:MAG: hypothetical protein ACKVTZ_06130 [Bacteroidia bacterium]
MGRIYDHQFVGAGLGVPYYVGDIAQTMGMLRPGINFSLGREMSKYANIKLQVMAGMYGAADSLSSGSRKDRNLHFISPLAEAAVIMEWEILRSFDNKFYDKSGISPYISYGLGLFFMSPYAKYQGKWHSLHALGTEGQYLDEVNYPKPYSKIQAFVPLSGGIKYFMNKSFAIYAELGYRFTFTDYMDDSGSGIYPDKTKMQAVNTIAAALSDPRKTGVSTGDVRGNPRSKDHYFYPNLGVIWVLKNTGSSGYR